MVDSTKKMRAICEDEPLWEEFLQGKGFPFKATNPITALVTFDDVVKLQKLDKESFLAEFEAYKCAHAEAGQA